MPTERERAVFSGFAKLKVIRGPHGKVHLALLAKGAGAIELPEAIMQLVGKLCSADDRELYEMGQQMR